MEKRPFREYHCLRFFSEYLKKKLPLDFALHKYFKSHKALGSKDRGWIAEAVYTITRWQGLIDYFIEGKPDYTQRLDLYKNFQPEPFWSKNNIPANVRASFPKILYDRFSKLYGERAFEICLALNTPAPTTVRTNTLKTTRKKLAALWHGRYEVSLCKSATNGIIFKKRTNFFELAEYKDGFFEVQDEASQLVSQMVEAKPGESILDYCAGSGGKTLAIAPQLKNKGQIYLHDIRPHALLEAKKRLKRAGVQNHQIVYPDDSKLKTLKKRMDWVLVDAPCTGSGTYRRNPDMKWKFSEGMLKDLVQKQRMIFGEAIKFLKPGGSIVYVTCSILAEENQEQIAHFLKTYPLELVVEFQSIPQTGGMDGLYGAHFILV